MTMRSLVEKWASPMPNPIPQGDPDLSAVLAIIGWNRHTERDEILLTKRTDQVETHKGQVSFPGGFWEEGDLHLLDTALRECREEIGLQSDAVQVLGGLEPVRTRGDILIYPWVGRIEYPYPFELNRSEVAGLLYLPVQTLLEEGLKQVTVDVAEGIKVESRGIWVDGELVWGATARLLEQLRESFLNSFR